MEGMESSSGSSAPSTSPSTGSTSVPSSTASPSSPSTSAPKPSGRPWSPEPGAPAAAKEGESPKTGHYSAEGEPAAQEGVGHAEPPKRYKVQVEGKEVEVEEAELLRGYQRARAAQQRFDEAAKHRQRAEQALQALQKDPFALLSDPKAFGVDPDVLDQLAERRMLAKLESQMLTPEQKAQREKDARLAQFEAQEQERQQKEQARAHELAKTQARADLQRRFIEVLDKTGVPKSPQAVARMANYLREAKMKGLDPDLYDVAELVKEDFASEQRGLYGGLEGDALLQAVGPEVAEKIRKAHLAKLDGAPGFMKPSGQSAPPAPSREPERLDEESFSERIRRRAGF